MYVPVKVYRGRTTKIGVALGIDVSADTITSQIRKEKNSDSILLAEWEVDFLSTGADGRLVLTIDDTNSNLTTHTTGFMDFKRMSGGEPIKIVDEPIPVVFVGGVTE